MILNKQFNSSYELSFPILPMSFEAQKLLILAVSILSNSFVAYIFGKQIPLSTPEPLSFKTMICLIFHILTY
jgi:hypothetical protein